MPEVSVSVELRVEVDPESDPVALEQAIWSEGRRAARDLYRGALEALDGAATEESGAARQRLEPRWVATPFGRVRMWRYRVRSETDSWHPLDRALGLGQAEASPGLRELVCDLALRLPFRQAAECAARITGEHMSPQSAWRILQAEGARIRGEEGHLIESVFDAGEEPPDVDAPALVIVEADGTYLRAQREDGDRFEVKTGVFYSGKKRAGGRRHRRWMLVDKGCYATTHDADAFGRALAAQGFWAVGLHHAKWVLCGHDGLDEFGQTFRDWFPGAVHQVDHYHVVARLWQISSGDADLYHRLKQATFENPRAVADKLRRGLLGIEPDKATELAGYLEVVADHLHGVDRLPRRLRRGRMRVVGTGVVEKHQDLVVGRRMKRRGMRWTRRGADNLLALQARRFSDRWPQRWGVIAA